jgi:hypothetical protein
LKRAISLAASGTVAKLRGARDRKRRLNGKCEGRKSLADIAPLAVAFARSLHKELPHMSYREIAAALQAERDSCCPSGRGLHDAQGQAYGAAAIQRMLEN